MNNSSACRSADARSHHCTLAGGGARGGSQPPFDHSSKQTVSRTYGKLQHNAFWCCSRCIPRMHTHMWGEVEATYSYTKHIVCKGDDHAFPVAGRSETNTMCSIHVTRHQQKNPGTSHDQAGIVHRACTLIKEHAWQKKRSFRQQCRKHDYTWF